MVATFIIPPEAWNAINTFGLVLIAVLSYFRGLKTSSKLEEVKQIVDGPLSAALRHNADLASRLSTLTGLPQDAEIAQQAATLVRNRELGKIEQTKQST